MKKYIAGTILVFVFLAAFIPFASSSPDGLRKVASSLGVNEQPFWQGFMSNYSVSALGNTYVSTLLAGFFGIVFVLTATLALGKAITKRSQTKNETS
jgi:ABC-type sulfate transport system permease component